MSNTKNREDSIVNYQKALRVSFEQSYIQVIYIYNLIRLKECCALQFLPKVSSETKFLPKNETINSDIYYDQQ